MMRLCLVLMLLRASQLIAATGDVLWDSRAYRVSIDVESTTSTLDAAATRELAMRVQENVRSRMGAFWRPTLAQEDAEADWDKRFHVQISTAGGLYQISVRETDASLGESDLAVVDQVATASQLPERIFTALTEAFRPLARYLRDPDNQRRVTLAYRAAKLAPDARLASATPGALLKPYRIKLDRSGAPLPDGLKLVPWTYLVVDANDENDRTDDTDDSDDSDATAAGPDGAQVISHTRRPFGVRPSNRQELLAIGAVVRPDVPTTLALHALRDATTPLPGYEVLIGDLDRSAPESIGFTNDDGELRLPLTDGVKRLYVKCGSIVVASLPVAGGVADRLTLPLIDERARLRAEVELLSLREELIDTVARRKIYGQRISRLVERGEFDAADELHGELDNLPGRTQFDRRLQEARRSAVATHPLAERRLDSLFEATTKVLNAALDPREVRDLAIAIDRARQGAAPASEGG